MKNITRRAFVAQGGMGAVALLSAPYIASAQERTLTVRDPGGPYTEGFAKAFYDPFLRETGIRVTGVQGEHAPTGLISSMVEAGNYVWDGAILSDNAHQVLAGKNYLAPIGEGGAINEIPKNLRSEYLLGVTVVGVTLSYRTDTVGENGMTSWADLWDVKNKPGYRSMRRSAFDTMEQALLADGVAPDALYPLDLDRAFKKLDEIKDNIAVWWTGGAQTSQLLATGEVDICPTWNARAQVAIDSGAPVAINWKGALYNAEGWSILRDGPKVDLMREFVQFCAQGQQQALYTNDLAYGPTNPSAYEHINPERAKVLPSNPKYLPNMIQTHAGYWREHGDRVNERFNAWLLG